MMDRPRAVNSWEVAWRSSECKQRCMGPMLHSSVATDCAPPGNNSRKVSSLTRR